MGIRNIKKQLIGKEDLELGFGQIIQERNGKNLEINRINAGIIPYTSDKSIAEALDIVINGSIDAGNLVFANLPTYADEATAKAAGLGQGRVYQTSTGELRIKL